MTKGALRYRFIPIDPEWHKSDLFHSLFEDFSFAGPLTWMIFNLEWREPHAEIQERTVNGKTVRGLYRHCRFSYIWDMLPKGIGAKTLTKVMMWMHNRTDEDGLRHWYLDPETCQLIDRWLTDGCQPTHRSRTSGRQMIGAWWPKLLKYREGVFGYIKESKGEDIKTGSTEPNQDQTESSFGYVLNPKTGEYDRVSLAEKELRGEGKI